MKKLVSLLLSASLLLTALPVIGYAVTPADNATDTDIVGKVKDVDGDGVIRVACVGDSITAGTDSYNYPMYLQEYLTYLGSKDGNTYVVKSHGKGAAACRHILENCEVDGDGDNNDYFYYDDNQYKSSLTYTPDVVIVQMGTNDALFGNWDNWDNYFNDDYYNYLVKPYADKGALVVLSTPPYAHNGMHDGNVNGPVHDKEVALANELGLPIVDTNRLLYGMPEILADGLHGNVTGYSMMAMNFYKYIFGGESITLNIEAEPNTRVDMVNKANNRSYVRVTDETGKASLEFLPGEYTFDMRAECTGFKRTEKTFTFNAANDTVTFELEVGGFNVALDGTGIACEAETYDASHNASTLNDASRTDGGYQPKDFAEGDWCGVQLDKAYDANMIVLYWETASYISTYQDKGYEVYVMVDGVWHAISEINQIIPVTRAAYSGDIVADTITLDPALKIEGVKVEFLNGTCDHKYAPKMYELEVLCDDPNGESGFLLGDVDGDGAVGAADLTALACHVGNIVLLTDADALKAADVDSDGEITASDLTKLARFVGGIIDSL